MKKHTIEDADSPHKSSVLRGGSRHAPSSSATSIPNPRIPALNPGTLNLNLEAEKRSLDGIGITELLDVDPDRLCFILDLTNKSNYQPGTLSLVFANKLLKASAFLDAVCGRLSDDSMSFGSYPDFKSWAVSFTKDYEPLEVALPSFTFSGATWTCSSLRKRFRVFYGVPTTSAAFPNSAPSSDTPGDPNLHYLTNALGASQPAAAASQEPRDYFGDAQYTGPASPARSPLAHPALKSPNISTRNIQAITRAARKMNSKMASSPLAHPATEVEPSRMPAPEPKRPADAHPSRHNSSSLLTDGTGFFDWTRLPLTPTLPQHIQFAKSVDWSATSLGPMETWPSDLRLVCNLLMASPHPAALYWGADNVAIYNEPYILLAGQKHPRLMGMRYEDAWKEIWDSIKDVFAKIKETGQAVMQDNDHLFVNRMGFLEETYFTWSLTPLISRDGSVSGLWNLGIDETRSKGHVASPIHT